MHSFLWPWLSTIGTMLTGMTMTDYAPTRAALDKAAVSIPRPLLRMGWSHLNAAFSELGNPTFTSYPTAWDRGDLCGAAQASQLFLGTRVHHRALFSEEWPVEKYGAYHFVLAISEELRLLLKDEVDKPHALLEALDGRLSYSIRCALHHFGRSLLTPCGKMPFLLGYICHWSMKSRRVAHQVLMELNDMATT